MELTYSPNPQARSSKPVYCRADCGKASLLKSRPLQSRCRFSFEEPSTHLPSRCRLSIKEPSTHLLSCCQFSFAELSTHLPSCCRLSFEELSTHLLSCCRLSFEELSTHLQELMLSLFRRVVHLPSKPPTVYCQVDCLYLNKR